MSVDGNDWLAAKGEAMALKVCYDRILGKLVKMQNNPDVWLLPRPSKTN